MNKKETKNQKEKKFNLEKVTILKQDNLKTVRGGDGCKGGELSKRETGMGLG